MNKVNIFVPDLPESVSDAVIVKWHKKIGDTVYYNDSIVDIETDKVMLEISSPCDGTLNIILKKEGENVISNDILGNIKKFNNVNKETIQPKKVIKNNKSFKNNQNINFFIEKNINNFTPSMRRLIRINNINEKLINFNKLDYILHQKKFSDKVNTKKKLEHNSCSINHTSEKRIKMTRLRQRISERLLEVKNNTVMLTTFNEVNMQSIILLRNKYNESFKEKYGIRLGFMSFFVKAVVEALKNFPEINASIDENEIVYYKNFDISIAVSTPRGLITPVLKNVDNMNMVNIEKKIKEFSTKGKENKITLDELIGGTFTITNGGIFGSLMSTPIINPPQTAILGMHAIKDRPMAINGKIKILPMMYLALSYDHRLIDGKESVSFLITVKNILEDFNRILINI